MDNEILSTLTEIKIILYVILVVIITGVIANWIRVGISFKSTIKNVVLDDFIDEATDLYDEENYKKLIKVSNEFLSKRKNNIHGLWYLAKAYYQLGDYKKSKKLFEKVVIAEPSWQEKYVKSYLEKIDLNQN